MNQIRKILLDNTAKILTVPFENTLTLTWPYLLKRHWNGNTNK